MITFGPMSVFLWILSFGSALAAGLLVYRSDKRKGLSRPWLTAFLRALVIMLVWVLLLSPTLPFRQTETRPQTVVILQDDSRSAGAALANDTGAFRQKITALQTAFQKENTRVLSFAFGSTLRQDSGFRYADAATDISGALEAALSRAGKFPPAAIILATDGRYNAGSNPLYASFPLSAPLHILSVGDTALEKDLRIGRIYAPRTVARGSSFEVRADVLATGLAGISTSASISGNGAGGTQAFPISGERFDRAVSFTLSAAKAGIYAYTLSLPSASGERNTENNTRRFYVEVVDRKKKILLAAAVPHPDIKAIREALSTVESYEVTVQVGTTVNTVGYDAAILHGLPASGFSTKVPTWFILTPSTSVAAFNAAQKTVQVDGTTAMQRFSYALPPSGFSLFIPPPGLDALLDRLPPLSVCGSGWRMAADAQALLRQRENNAAPLWAVRSGRPAEAVTVGEGIWRWRLSEYRQKKEQRIVDECIRQTVAFLAAGMGDRKFRLDMPKWEWNDGEGIVLNGYLLNEGGQSVNNAEASITLTDSAGRARSYRMERVGSSYRLNIGSLLPGSYRFAGKAVLEGKSYTDEGAFVVTETPIELLQTGADYPFLQSLAARFKGTVRPWQQADSVLAILQKSDALKPRISQNEDPKPLIDWKWMFVLILGVATAEWLVRRYGE